MSNKINPASPLIYDRMAHGRGDQHLGLSKREYFAGLAMSGFAAHPKSYEMAGHTIAIVAISWADCLLAALAKETHE